MQFFYGSENAELGQKLYQFGLNEDRKKICRQQSKCKCFLQQNKMSIYIKTGNIFFNNVNSVESIYDFLVAQQSYNIKKMEFGFTFQQTTNLMFLNTIKNTNIAIKAQTKDKNDMLTNKKSKFLFYNFNSYINRQAKQVQKVRHTIISEDEHELLELHKKKVRSYFLGKILEISEKDNFELANEGSEIKSVKNEL